MIFSMLAKGIGLGFAIAMPVGPIGILCVRYSLTQGMRGGLAAGIGAALADVVYAVLAAVGMGTVSSFLGAHALWFQLLGAGFLCFLGIRTLLEKRKKTEATVVSSGSSKILITTFLLTIVNPATFLSFALLSSAFIGGAGSLPVLLLLALGIFLGSTLWWIALSLGTSLFSRTLNIADSRWMNRLSAVALFGFAAVLLLEIIHRC